jgi:SNF2 family DNA or RNA helicase
MAARAVCGGILADSVGVGKTIQILGALMDGRRKKRPCANLVVVPNSLQRSWQKEIVKLVEDEFHDQALLWQNLASFGEKVAKKMIESAWIVIATFEEVVKPGCLLQSLKWHRIVVDEAQNIKNSTSNRAKVLGLIEAEYRWLLSATPLVNGRDDFYSYLKFLRLPETESRRKFNKAYGFGQAKGTAEEREASSERLQEILSCLLLQRTGNTKYFGVRTVNIPPSTNCRIEVSDLLVQQRTLMINSSNLIRSQLRFIRSSLSVPKMR